MHRYCTTEAGNAGGNWSLVMDQMMLMPDHDIFHLIP